MVICSPAQASASALFPTLLAAIAAIIGGAVSGILGVILRWWNRPRLVIEFNSGRNGFEVDSSWKDKEGKQIQRRFVRLLLRNAGRNVANNCRVYLVDVQSVHSAGELHETTFDMCQQLSWPGWNFEPLEVYNKVPLFVDLISVDKSEPGWLFQMQNQSLDQQSLKNYSGVYRFFVAAVADNAKPFFFALDVEYRNDWTCLRATSVRDSKNHISKNSALYGN